MGPRSSRGICAEREPAWTGGLWSQEEEGSDGRLRDHGDSRERPGPPPSGLGLLFPNCAFLGHETGARGCVLGPGSGVSLTWNLRGAGQDAAVACATRHEECRASAPTSTQRGGSRTRGPSGAWSAPQPGSRTQAGRERKGGTGLMVKGRVMAQVRLLPGPLQDPVPSFCLSLPCEGVPQLLHSGRTGKLAHAMSVHVPGEAVSIRARLACACSSRGGCACTRDVWL